MLLMTETFFTTIIDLMKQVQIVRGMSGKERKEVVLLQLRRELEKRHGEGSVIVKAAMCAASDIIDGICAIANKELSIKVLKKASKSCGCAPN